MSSSQDQKKFEHLIQRGSPQTHLMGRKPLHERRVQRWMGLVLGVGLSVGAMGLAMEHPMGQEVIETTQHVLSAWQQDSSALKNFTTRRQSAQQSLEVHWVGDGSPKRLDPFTRSYLWDPATEQLQSDFSSLLDFFQQRGVDDQQARVIVAMMQTTQQVTLVQDDLVLLEQETLRVQYAQSWLTQAWDLLKQPEGAQSLAWKNHVQEGQQTDMAQPFFDGKWQEGWTGVQAQLMQPWMVLFPELTQRHGVEIETDASLSEAHHTLEQTVRQTGLAGIRVPLSMLNNPDALIEMAHMLGQTNDELQRVTGLKGQTLGLHGRVVLDLQTVQQPAVTYRDSANGYIVVRSFWDKLPHEWFHALDLSLSEQVRMLPGHGPHEHNTLSSVHSPQLPTWMGAEDGFHLLTAQRVLWQRLQDPQLTPEQRKDISAHTFIGHDHDQPALVQSINRQASEQVVSEGSVWMHWRQQMAQQTEGRGWGMSEEERYVRNNSETLAFAFSSQVQHRLQSQTSHASHLLHAHDVPSVAHTVSETESKAQRMAWDEYFHTLNSWWNQDHGAPALSSQRIKLKRSDTSLDSTPPASPISKPS